MNPLPSRWLSSALMMVGVLLSVPSAHACQCTGSPRYDIEHHDHLLIVRVLAARKVELAFEIEFEPAEVLKGKPVSSPLRARDRTLCGLSHVAVGLEYALLVHETPGQGGMLRSVSYRSFAIDSRDAVRRLESLRHQIAEAAPTRMPHEVECAQYVRAYRARYTHEHPEVIRARELAEAMTERIESADRAKRTRELCPDLPRA